MIYTVMRLILWKQSHGNETVIMRCLLIIILQTTEGPKRSIPIAWMVSTSAECPVFFSSIYQQVQIYFILPNMTQNNETWTICIIWTTKLTRTVSRNCLFFIKQLLLIPILLPRNDFKFCQIFDVYLPHLNILWACLSNIQRYLLHLYIWCVFHISFSHRLALRVPGALLKNKILAVCSISRHH